MVQKLVFFDIDGTIVREDNYEIPESTIAAIKKLRANGHLAFINTGRPYSLVDEKIRSLGFDGYICSCGSYILLGDEVLLHKTLTPEKSARIVELVRKFNLDVIYEALSGMYFDLKRPLSEKLHNYKTKFESLGLYTGLSIDEPGFHFDKFIVWTNDDTDFAAFYSEFEDEFDYIDRGNRLIEFAPKGHSKATGIQLVLDKLGLELDNCFAIGDSTNDLPMLDYVPNSIAMGNSPEVLFDRVTFVTRRIEDDGLEFALRHFKLI